MATNKPFIGGNFPPEIAQAMSLMYGAQCFMNLVSFSVSCLHILRSYGSSDSFMYALQCPDSK